LDGPLFEVALQGSRHLLETAAGSDEALAAMTESDEIAWQVADALLRRRSLMVGLAAVASTLFWPAQRRRKIGMADVSQLNALVALYRGADHQFGGSAIADDIGQVATAAGDLLSHDVNDEVRPHLFAAIAAARYLAGWTAFDAIRHTDAQRHFVASERVAVESGDRQLVAYVRYGQAKQLQHQRHNHDALDTLRMAHLHLTVASPGLIATLRGTEAASRAALGDFDGARRALDQAADAFADVDPATEPERLGFLSLGEVYAQAGRIYRDWARHDARRGPEAVLWVTEAIKAFDAASGRSTVLNQVGLASALFLADDPDGALLAGHRAQNAATGISSPRLAERLWNLRRDARLYMGRSDVADFINGLPRPVTA
jgi:hypothetical protein